MVGFSRGVAGSVARWAELHADKAAAAGTRGGHGHAAPAGAGQIDWELVAAGVEWPAFLCHRQDMSDIRKWSWPSGGLDTPRSSCAGCRITTSAEVVTFTADIGRGEEVEPARAKAQAMGVEIYIDDLREEFVRDFVFPMFRANTIYEGEYLLGTSIARPLIAKRLIEIANETSADAISHGATGKVMTRCGSNRRLRIEAGVKVIAPGARGT